MRRFGVTGQQRRLLDFLKAFIAEHRKSPTHREICKALGLVSPSASFRLVASLEERGMVRRLENRARSIILTEDAGKAAPLSPDIDAAVAIAAARRGMMPEAFVREAVMEHLVRCSVSRNDERRRA